MNEEPVNVACGARHLAVPRADAFVPRARTGTLHDPQAAIEAALARPMGAPRLRDVARGARSVALVIPDASRACPTPTLLPPLLAELGAAGIGDERIRIIVGCGLHARNSAVERAQLAGGVAGSRFEILDAHGIESPIVALGMTSQGAPIEIARRVAEADLVLTVGVVEPHLYAGFSGGVKGVAIGCASESTIAWTHHPAFISLPGVSVGKLRGNPFQEALIEIAARAGLLWAVNAVVDARGQIARIEAGDPVAVQTRLADRMADAWFRRLETTYDVLVAGVPAPKSAGLYQASRAATYACLAGRPALNEGGTVVLCADLPDGAGRGPGERNFFAALEAAASPTELVERGLRDPLGHGGQRAFVVARALQRYRIAVVGSRAPGFLAPLERLGLTAFDSVDAAVGATESRLGRRARVLAVADATTTIATRFDAANSKGRT